MPNAIQRDVIATFLVLFIATFLPSKIALLIAVILWVALTLFTKPESTLTEKEQPTDDET